MLNIQKSKNTVLIPTISFLILHFINVELNFFSLQKRNLQLMADQIQRTLIKIFLYISRSIDRLL